MLKFAQFDNIVRIMLDIQGIPEDTVVFADVNRMFNKYSAKYKIDNFEDLNAVLDKCVDVALKVKKADRITGIPEMDGYSNYHKRKDPYKNFKDKKGKPNDGLGTTHTLLTPGSVESDSILGTKSRGSESGDYPKDVSAVDDEIENKKNPRKIPVVDHHLDTDINGNPINHSVDEGASDKFLEPKVNPAGSDGLATVTSPLRDPEANQPKVLDTLLGPKHHQGEPRPRLNPNKRKAANGYSLLEKPADIDDIFATVNKLVS